MIIWINGAFGAGKTTAAAELHRRLPDSYVYDPENVGYFLRKNMPKECDEDDFQDIPLWRAFNADILKRISERYSGTIIVPMTIAADAGYHEIVEKLEKQGIPLRHFILCASKQTLLSRLRRRSLGRLDRDAFAVNAMDRCLAFFQRVPGIPIRTDDLTPGQTAELIAQISGLTLLPDRRGKLTRTVDRWKTLAEHIRF